ncbi:hypothetical protein HPB50_025055 [Hyalomma asiaticum]|uniref:Uncharacterized protein n=1 Tax=Hyalomma asiaticum TaxID=266040 RepID=A0ACB7T9C0_HYAAI|nr:hypothetical protein HPB50_025055 [Hyalomma asiaticum]
MLVAFTLFNVSYWYAQWDSRRRVSPPRVLRLPTPDHTFIDRREKTKARPRNVPLELLFWRPVESLLKGYGRLPFPVENVAFLPVAYSVVHRCRTGGPLSYIFFVHSAPKNWVKRRLLRETIGDIAMATKHSWTTVFFVGMSRNLGVQRKVLDEAEQHGDVVMLPYVDAYRNLTYKYVYGIKWTMDNCPAVRYVVKMDDDMVINLTKLVAYLERRNPREPAAFHCYVWTNMMVDRNTASPWYLSRKMYRKGVFSPYCSGSTVLFASKVMEAVYNASFDVPFIPVDDAYVTGEVAKKAGVGHVSLNRAKNRRRSWDIIMKELREPTLAFQDYETSFQEDASGGNRSDDLMPDSALKGSPQASGTNAALDETNASKQQEVSYEEDTYLLSQGSDACLTNFTSNAKRWLPVLAIGTVVYATFWTVGYNPIGTSPSLPYSTPGDATVAMPESSYNNEQNSRQNPRRNLDPIRSTSSKSGGPSKVSAGNEQHGRATPEGSSTKIPVASSSEPSGLTAVTSSTVVATRAAKTTVTSPKMAPTSVTETAPTDELGHTWTPSDQLQRGFDKVPFPLENVTTLPTAYKVVSDCRRDLDYLFFVHTAATHSDHRRVLREVVANSTYGARYNWTTVFFVGMSSVDKVTRSVASEAEANGDLVVLPYMDTYRNLTYKFVYGIKWTLENCPRVRYVLKMDDDIVVHLPSLMKKLDGGKPSPSPARPKLYCCVWDGMPVIRQTALPWYMSEKMYPKNVFPRYCSGSAVFMDAAALGPLYNATFAVPYIPIDDAYVTGELAAVAGVGHESLNRFYSFDSNKWQSVVSGSLMVVQVWNAEARSSAWKSVADALGREQKERTDGATTSTTSTSTPLSAVGRSASVRDSSGPASAERSTPTANTPSGTS